MKRFWQKKYTYLFFAVLGIASITVLVHIIEKNNTVTYVTHTVESGPVRQVVSVSGVTDAKKSASLSFPTTGIAEAILVEVGDVVNAGDMLAVLDTAVLQAERQDAQAALIRALAARGELLAGPRVEARTVTSQEVALKKEALTTTKLLEESKVRNARFELLSNQLSAVTADGDENAQAPTVSGTYTCDTEGSYTLSVYSSDAPSGYSYRLSGLENGSYTASVDQPMPLGTCGLRIQFDKNSTYSNSTWIIAIPNKNSPTYALNKNSYTLALTQASSSILLAEQEVMLAEATADNTNASPRTEELLQASANVAQAQAQVARIDALLAERIMRAPFAGTVTSVAIKAGEKVDNTPVLSLVANSAFEVTARVPEIDIGKLAIGQRVEMVFDAKDDELVNGTITFISLEATQIDGVSYFEAYITPDQTPPWLRSGLNADIDIILAEASTSLRVPKRFLTESEGISTVRLKNGETIATTTVSIVLSGNDGFVAITGLNTGDVIVAP